MSRRIAKKKQRRFKRPYISEEQWDMFFKALHTIGYQQKIEKEALRMIDEQETISAASPKWISVKDRLPEHDGEVLAYCGGNIFIANCPEDEWVVYCLEEGGYSETCHVQVDYWMPLPETPEVEDGDDDAE